MQLIHSLVLWNNVVFCSLTAESSSKAAQQSFRSQRLAAAAFCGSGGTSYSRFLSIIREEEVSSTCVRLRSRKYSEDTFKVVFLVSFLHPKKSFVYIHPTANH